MVNVAATAVSTALPLGAALPQTTCLPPFVGVRPDTFVPPHLSAEVLRASAVTRPGVGEGGFIDLSGARIFWGGLVDKLRMQIAVRAMTGGFAGAEDTLEWLSRKGGPVLVHKAVVKLAERAKRGEMEFTILNGLAGRAAHTFTAKDIPAIVELIRSKGRGGDMFVLLAQKNPSLAEPAIVAFASLANEIEKLKDEFGRADLANAALFESVVDALSTRCRNFNSEEWDGLQEMADAGNEAAQRATSFNLR